MVAGETSGDQAAAPAVAALRRFFPRGRILAVGGPRMREAGAEILFPASELSVMGFGEVLRHLPRLWKRRNQVRRLIRSGRPDLFIPVDAPGFNLSLAREARLRGVPVLYYVAPQVWAWGAGRLKAMRRDLSGLAVFLPFEEEWFRRRGIHARFVGHPLAGKYMGAGPADRRPDRIGLMPGSRSQEVSRHLPRLLEAAGRLAANGRNLTFSILEADSIPGDIYDGYMRLFKYPVKRFRGDAQAFFAEQDLIWAGSGTATLEAALADVPMVVLYRTGALNYQLARRLVKLDRIALVNLVAGRELVPELIQDDASPESLAETMAGLLEDPEARSRQREGFREIRLRLGSLDPGAELSRMAGEILEGHER
jgi:lipid-A-disaccharide synthase